MKKGLLVIIFTALSTFFISAQAYNKTQLDQFEKTNKCNKCDLSSAVITWNHSGAELNDANLSNISFRNKHGGNFALASLKNANLSGAHLVNSNLSHADLTGTHLDAAHLYMTNIYGAIGADFSNADICMATLPDGSQGKCSY